MIVKCNGTTAQYLNYFNPKNVANLFPRLLPKPFTVYHKNYGANGRLYTYLLSRFNLFFIQLTDEERVILDMCNGNHSFSRISEHYISLVDMNGKEAEASINFLFFSLNRNKVIYWMDKRGTEDVWKKFESALLKEVKLECFSSMELQKFIKKNYGIGYSYVPAHLTIPVTLRCNANCIMCFMRDRNSDFSKIKEAKLDDIKRVLKEASEIGVDDIKIFGGEPFVREDIFDILEECAHLDLGIYVFTNGIFLSKRENVKRLSKILSNAPFHKVQVSLEGNREIHNKQRPGADYDLVLKSLQNLKEEEVRFFTNTTITKDNIQDIEHVIKIGVKYGAEGVSFSPMLLLGRGNYLIAKALSPKELLDLKKEFRNLRKKYEGIYIEALIQTPPFLDENIRPHKTSKFIPRTCKGFSYEMSILPDGSLIPCDLWVHHPKYWGENVYEKGLMHAWHSSELSKYFRNLPVKGKCSYCEYKENCERGCPLVTLTVTGDITAEDPLCWYKPGIKESAYEIPNNFKYLKKFGFI